MLTEREQRGLQIAALAKIEKNRLGWKVPSQSGNGSYVVSVDGESFCSCPDFEARHLPCKHIYAVEYVIQRETKADGSTIYTETMRVSYSQEWPAYNMAQTHEQERFVKLLRSLCDGIPQPAQTVGRPRLPLSDVVFHAVLKSYTTMSGRRAMGTVQGALEKAPSYQSAFRYLENPEMTPLLKTLIESSALPLKEVETDFAVDSSGFSTCTYDRWFDHKYGRERSQAKFVKLHMMCGVKTNVVTSVEATPGESSDATRFPGLVERTAQHFTVNEVSADKAYSSKRNLRMVQAIGGTAYIPFKSNATAVQGYHKFDGLWQYMWAFYQFNRPSFLAHYHKRSNAETTFSMIKAKFGAAVRSKTPVAQVNEVLCKVLCHNICCLIQSMYELGIEPTFETEGLVVSKVMGN